MTHRPSALSLSRGGTFGTCRFRAGQIGTFQTCRHGLQCPDMKVLVIVARGLQAGALGCYGNRWARTPALDSLAATGALFDQHFADFPSPEGARRAWRTGCYVFPSPPGASAVPSFE